MERRKPGVDVILDVLKLTAETFPDSTFAASLLQQYNDRGFLTKPQLEGLMNKASKVYDMPPGKLATLQSIIQKLPTRFKSEKPVNTPVYEKNIPVQIVIASILEKYPGHKRVLFFKQKNDSLTPLSSTEISELQRFYKLLVKKE